MQKLRPDRVGHSGDVARAIELAREARECCERGLSQQKPPDSPYGLTFTPLCMVPGRRRIKLEWQTPRQSEVAPLRRFVVAAFDPSYGRALTIAFLEPDYSEELRRFVPVEELRSYILAEEDLFKMPEIFRESHLTMQVAAANESGQSPWATLRVPLV